ncbi:hypothetical protein RHGRI_030860 [Rhododendron griersonianum]|uniref:Uncharacterized protein n=1 Tax=Rhododendron griersonianum TaxID=479676 RepID=A0AAV6IA91_9ERIC|nr:hypothetical protein RHGRI_030860 [Rhododendron griersonianum]
MVNVPSLSRQLAQVLSNPEDESAQELITLIRRVIIPSPSLSVDATGVVHECVNLENDRQTSPQVYTNPAFEFGVPASGANHVPLGPDTIRLNENRPVTPNGALRNAGVGQGVPTVNNTIPNHYGYQELHGNGQFGHMQGNGPYSEFPEKSNEFASWWRGYIKPLFSKPVGKVLKDLALPPPPEPKKGSAKAKATSVTSSKRKGFEEEEDEEVEQTPAPKKVKRSPMPTSKATTGKDQTLKASKTAIADRTRASASKSPPEGSPPTVAKSKGSSKGAKAIVAKTPKPQDLVGGDSSDSSGGSETTPPASGEVKTTSFSLGTPKTQPSAEKKPVLLDLDDESFDQFFQTVEELVKPTASGASSSGIGSSTPSSFAPEEIIQAKEVLKAALGLGIDSVFHQDHYPSVRKSMNVLVKSQALGSNAEPALQSFLRDFPNSKRSYESATQKCALANFKLTKIDDLQQELKQGFGARDQLRTEINEAKTKCAGLLTSIQTLETELNETRQQLADHEQHEASLVQRRQELLDAAQGPLSALQLLMVEKPKVEASRDQAKVVINDAVTAWDSLKATLESEL